MLRLFPALVALALASSLLGAPAEVTAQVRVSLQWSGIHSGGPYVHAEFGTGGAYVVGSFGQPSRRYRTAHPRGSVYVRRGVSIPPGHLPGPGQCRVWHPNRPPGHQPPPFRCSDRYHDPYGSAYGTAYGSGYGHGGGPQVYPRPEHGPRGGYYDAPRADTPRYDEPRYEDRRYEDSGNYAPGRVPASVETTQRWSGLEQIAMERRRQLARQGPTGRR